MNWVQVSRLLVFSPLCPHQKVLPHLLDKTGCYWHIIPKTKKSSFPKVKVKKTKKKKGKTYSSIPRLRYHRAPNDVHSSRYTKWSYRTNYIQQQAFFKKQALLFIFWHHSNSQNGSLQAVQDYQGNPSQTHPHIQHLEQRNRFMAAASAQWRSLFIEQISTLVWTARLRIFVVALVRQICRHPLLRTCKEL